MTATPAPAPEFEVACDDVVAEPYAAGPVVRLRMRLTELTGVRVHALALRCQVRVEPLKRAYSDGEAARVVDLFGERSRWGSSMHPLQLAFWSQVLPGFRGTTTFDLDLPISYDVEVAAHKYLTALADGAAPLLLLFSGQAFLAGMGPTGAPAIAVQPLPWHLEAPARLPVTVWRRAMDAHYPGQAWLRVSRETYDALAARRSELGLVGWDVLLAGLLEER